MDSLLLKNGTLITMNPRLEVMKGDVLIEGTQISQIGKQITKQAATVLDATDRVVLPGLIQTHIHLCQTIMRGAADDLSLLDWLKKRIWPMEAAHDEQSLSYSAQLGLAELIQGGTTTILTMETVSNTDVVFEQAQESGIRAVIGKCFMNSGQGVPKGLLQSSRQALDEALALFKKWHRASEGRIGLALAPRFVLSCTEGLLYELNGMAREYGLLVHSHAAESRDEVKLVKQRTGMSNVEVFHKIGLANPRLCLAHCIWLSPGERRLLKQTRTRVLHCPSSNLKLGSGVASVWKMLQAGISVSLGADGAPCNNSLDMFQEMRLASLLQKMRHGPEAMPAESVLKMATLEGARALGLDKEIGSIEIGKRADLIIVNLEKLHNSPNVDPVSTLVYSAKSSDVETCIVDGRILMKNRELLTLDREKISRESRKQFNDLIARAGI